MSEPITYRIVQDPIVGAFSPANAWPQDLIEMGLLVPDTRLKDIADLWNSQFPLSECKHLGDLVVQRNNGIRYITCVSCQHDFHEIHPHLPPCLDALVRDDSRTREDQ